MRTDLKVLIFHLLQEDAMSQDALRLHRHWRWRMVARRRARVPPQSFSYQRD